MRHVSYGSWWRQMWRTAATRRRRPGTNPERLRTRPLVEQLEHRLAPAMLALTVMPNNVQAGQSFILEVQAEDSGGNPIAMGGTVNLTTTDPQVPTLPAITLNSSTGLGFAADNLQTATATGWTISGTTTGASGTSGPIIVTASSPVKLAFGTQPTATATGNVINPAVTVNLEDLYGNVVTSGSDSSDVVTLSVGSGPGSFTASSTTAATMTSGVATFSNLTLVAPGSYSLSPAVPAKFVGQNSSTFSVTPLQVKTNSLAGSPSGFSVQFNAPFLVNSVTPALYGTGFGGTASVTPTVTLTQTTGTPPSGSTLPFVVPGSLVVNTATNSLTFVETNTASIVGNNTPVLPDGTYVVAIHSSGANGLQAFNSGGGYLDGTNAGTPGHDFTGTFTVGAGAANDDVLWVPATANGPGQPLRAPGQNQSGIGYPVFLDDNTGTATDVQATLTYNPALLTVTPTSNATFTVTVPTAGTATLHYNGPALAKGVQTLGLLTATVPAGTAGNPTPYRAKDLLQLSNVTLNGSNSAVLGSNAVHLVSYVGDADGNGSYSSGDAVLITRVTLQTDTGFAAYPLIDPTIIGDTDGSGFIPADAALQANEAGVGFQTANLATPPIPPGVVFQPVPANVDPSLSIPSQLQVAADGTLTVPVNIDDPHPAGSTGLVEAHLALTYNPGDFTVSPADIHLGSVLAAGSGWTVTPTIDPLTGQIALALSSTTPITSAQGGSLVTIDFHPVGRISNPSAIDLVASASPNGRFVMTELEDAQGTFTLTPAPTNAFDPRIDGVVTSAAAPVVLPVSSPVVSAPDLIESGPATTTETAADLVAAPEEVTPRASAPELENATVPAEATPAPATPAVVHASAGISLAPLAGFVFQVASSASVNIATSTWQRLSDQLFQSLGHVLSPANEPSLVVAIKDAFDATAASPYLRALVVTDNSDTGEAQVGADVDGQATARDARPVASQETAADRTPSQDPLTSATADRAAVDRYFAQSADEMDDILQDD